MQYFLWFKIQLENYKKNLFCSPEKPFRIKWSFTPWWGIRWKRAVAWRVHAALLQMSEKERELEIIPAHYLRGIRIHSRKVRETWLLTYGPYHPPSNPRVSDHVFTLGWKLREMNPLHLRDTKTKKKKEGGAFALIKKYGYLLSSLYYLLLHSSYSLYNICVH